MEKEHNKRETQLNLGSLFFGLTLILVGLLFIGSRTGFIPFIPVRLFFWLEFFWPLLFITIGLSLVRVQSLGGKILGVLATFAIIFFITILFLNWFVGFGQNHYFRQNNGAPYWMPHFEIHKLPNGFNLSF
jgi:hypothetical protein